VSHYTDTAGINKSIEYNLYNTQKTIHPYFPAGSQTFMANVAIATRFKVSISSNLVSDPH